VDEADARQLLEDHPGPHVLVLEVHDQRRSLRRPIALTDGGAVAGRTCSGSCGEGIVSCRSAAGRALPTPRS
jgi:hypothetical protein